MILIVLASCSPNNEKIIVAVVLPMNGPVTETRYVIEGLELASHEINENGGVNGKHIDLIVSESYLDAASIRRAFVELERNAEPLFYISVTDIISLELGSVAEKYSVVIGGLASSIQQEVHRQNWTFSYFSTVEQEVLPIHQILEQLNVKKLGIIYQNDQLGRLYEKKLRTSFTGPERKILSESFEYSSPGSVKYSTLTDLCDAIYVTGFTDNLAEILRELRARHYSGIILADSGLASLNLLSTKYNDIYLPAPVLYNFNNAYANSTKKRYEERYLKKFTHFAANGYDFIHIVAGLLENKHLSRDTVRSRLLSQFSYPGVFGYIEKQEGEHYLNFSLYPARVVGGKIHYLE